MADEFCTSPNHSFNATEAHLWQLVEDIFSEGCSFRQSAKRNEHVTVEMSGHD